MDKLIKYCCKNNIEYQANCGGGITLFCPVGQAEKVKIYIKTHTNVKYNPLKDWCNWDYTIRCMPCF